MIQLKSTQLQFLAELKTNNNRDWFTANKAWYQQELQHFKRFSEAVLERMNAIDHI